MALLAGGAILALAVWRARGVVAAHSAELARRQRVERLFGRYVPEAVATRLIEQPGELAPTVQTATAQLARLIGSLRTALNDYQSQLTPGTFLNTTA